MPRHPALHNQGDFLKKMFPPGQNTSKDVLRGQLQKIAQMSQKVDVGQQGQQGQQTQQPQQPSQQNNTPQATLDALNQAQRDLDFLNSDFLAPLNVDPVALSNTIGRQGGLGGVTLDQPTIDGINNIATQNPHACTITQSHFLTIPSDRFTENETNLTTLSRLFKKN